MSYSLHVARDPKTGRFEVAESGAVPEGHFTVSGHHQPGETDEITVQHHAPDGAVTVRGHGFAGHGPAVAHHAEQHWAEHHEHTGHDHTD